MIARSRNWLAILWELWPESNRSGEAVANFRGAGQAVAGASCSGTGARSPGHLWLEQPAIRRPKPITVIFRSMLVPSRILSKRQANA